MRRPAAVARSLLMAASIGMVMPITAVYLRGEESTEEVYEVIGQQIQRPDGRLLGLAVESGKFVLRFYDKDKKPIPADAARVLAIWDPVNKIGKQRAVLNVSGTNELSSPAKVKPPLNFKCTLTLIGADEKAFETYPIMFQQ